MEPQLALVTELLDRKDWIKDPKAVAAVRKEFDGLTSKNTWDLSSVTEEREVIQRARESESTIHIGDICSKKAHS